MKARAKFKVGRGPGEHGLGTKAEGPGQQQRIAADERRGTGERAKDASPVSGRATTTATVQEIAAQYAGAKIGVFVAHPDDETMWAGGLISALDSPFVFSCSIPHRDPIRALKFFDACDCLGARARLFPYIETPGKILLHLNYCVPLLRGFDLIITHNCLGEYGHVHHEQVHYWASGNVKCPVLTFGYFVQEGIQLPKKLAESKMAALRCYDHRSPSDGGLMKWEALLRVYKRVDILSEIYIYA